MRRNRSRNPACIARPLCPRLRSIEEKPALEGSMALLREVLHWLLQDEAAVDTEEAKRRLAAKNAKKAAASKATGSGKSTAVAEAKARAAKAKNASKPTKSEQFPPRR